MSIPEWLATKECIHALGYSEKEEQALQAEMSVMLERAKQQQSKVICHDFDNRKRKFNQIQNPQMSASSSVDKSRRLSN